MAMFRLMSVGVILGVALLLSSSTSYASGINNHLIRYDLNKLGLHLSIDYPVEDERVKLTIKVRSRSSCLSHRQVNVFSKDQSAETHRAYYDNDGTYIWKGLMMIEDYNALSIQLYYDFHHFAGLNELDASECRKLINDDLYVRPSDYLGIRVFEHGAMIRPDK